MTRKRSNSFGNRLLMVLTGLGGAIAGLFL